MARRPACGVNWEPQRDRWPEGKQQVAGLANLGASGLAEGLDWPPADSARCSEHPVPGQAAQDDRPRQAAPRTPIPGKRSGECGRGRRGGGWGGT
ncbi:hypothetical protein GCM10010172_10810 [Paractinoplanes ferrugineus]|uniref:Uncharacterized protein n=1 Tax=Paractinoplanes ferrugineus TaxID=113564 RepID=A0A919MEL0_9ACTN|nr:hypothetical protein Afe05nite_14850 [Actinoplanes ferrugineus]